MASLKNFMQFYFDYSWCPWWTCFEIMTAIKSIQQTNLTLSNTLKHQYPLCKPATFFTFFTLSCQYSSTVNTF